MYLGHFGLNDPPFRITPDTEVFFAGANRGATLDALLYAITHDEGIVKVSGEVGSGKTMLCRVLIERLPANVETIYLANPSLAREEILIAIADELKLDLGSERSTRVLRSLQEALVRLYAAGRRVVVLIDEAHAMPSETLEEIRLLSNLEANRHKLLQIVLFGQPELDEHLNTTGMRQLKERITHSFRLAPLGREDIESYIDFRLRAAGYRGPNPFNTGAIRMIVAASEGLTRRINILSDKALLAAFASNTHSVTEREVKRAVKDCDFYTPARRIDRAALGVLGAAAGLAAGFAIAWFMLPSAGPVVPTPMPASVAAPSAAAGPELASVSTVALESMPARRAVEPPAKPPVAKELPAAKSPQAQPAMATSPSPRGAPRPATGKRVVERFDETKAGPAAWRPESSP